MGLLDWFIGANPAAAVAQGVATGVLDGVKGIIREFHLPPEQQLAAEMKVDELRQQLEQAIMADRQSARQMQMQTKSWVPGALTVLNTAGFFAVCGYMMKYGLPSLGDQGTEALLLMIGALVSGYGLCLQFWLGSSSGSQAKDWMMWKSMPANGEKK